MKPLLKLLIVLVVLVVVAAVAAPFLIPVETYKTQITQAVKNATGRDLMIKGAMRASVFPSLGLSAEQVTLSNPPGFSSGAMADIASLKVEVELVPLLSKRVEIKRFILERPVIHLEVNAKGENNWNFSGAPAAVKAPKSSMGFISGAVAQEAATAPGTANPFAALQHIKLGDIRVKDGSLSFSNAQSKQKFEAKKLELTLDVRDISSPLALNGTAEWNGQPVKLAATIKSPSALADNKESAADLTLQSGNLLQVIYSGKISARGAQGKAEFGTTSIPQFAAWAGSPFAWKGTAPLAFGFRGPLSCTTTSCSLSETDMVLDATKFKGTVSLAWGGAKPLITARLSTDALDVNPYLPREKHASLPSFIADAEAAAWNTAPIDLSALRLFNAEVNFTVSSVLYEKLKLGKTVINATISGGILQLSIPEVNLYGGKALGNATLNGAGSGLGMDSQLTLSGVQAEPFLRDLNGFDRLKGTLAMEISTTTRGANEQQLVSGLNGKGRVMLTNGAINGVNIPQMVRELKSTVKMESAGAAKQTDFSELGGTFTIANGIVSNNDLAMKAPLLRLKGAGTVDLPKQYVNYRLSPEIVSTFKGQGGQEKEGLGIPVIVEGPFEALTFRPDFESAARDALQNPEKAKETVKNVKEQIKEIRQNPDGIKGLLKGLGGR